jgi:hypothetical protein
MAKVYQVVLDAGSTNTQAVLDALGHSLVFADKLQPVLTQAEGGVTRPAIIVTSGVESDGSAITGIYELLADDSQSEVAIDISSGKFVEGNVIATFSTLSEARNDLRDFMSFYMDEGDIQLHIGVCNTTQSQDYTPDIIANSRPILMLTPTQVQSLGL